MTYDWSLAEKPEDGTVKLNRGFSWFFVPRLMRIMRESGMIFDPDPNDVIPWPSGRHLTDDDWDEEDPQQWSPARREYEAKAKVAAEQRFECPGIPSTKFSNNEPWRIWPDEILSALAKLRENPRAADAVLREEDRQYWPEIIAFLEDAAKHGGLIVH